MKKYILLVILIATGLAFTSPPNFPQQLQLRGDEIQSVFVDREAVDLQKEILNELKVLNIYMSKITGENFKETDIE